MKFFHFLLFTFIFISACSKITPLEQAKQFAGSNQVELEKVLQHYTLNPKDSLKLRAAKFLIENMPYHYYLDGPEVKDYYNMADTLFYKIGKAVNFLERDSLVKIIAVNKDPGKRTPIYDINVIKADMLISHIDCAFKTLEYPWTKELSFEDFCEYILPYRLINEPIEDWMPIYQEHLKTVTDSLIMSNAADTSICVFFIPHIIPIYPELTEYSFKTDLKPSQYIRLKAGSCSEINALGAYTLRSIGIPVLWDFTPQWANRSRGHDWNAIWVGSKCYPFQFGENVRFGNHLKSRRHDKLSKIYRKMYSIQDESLAMQKVSEEIPSFFQDPFLKDVSELYCEVTDITIDLIIPAPEKKQIAYLMVFNNQEWVPIDWGHIKKGKAQFKKVRNDVVYLTMYYHDKKFYSASNPFYINTSNQIIQLTPQKDKKSTVLLNRKYPNFDTRVLRDRLPGGRFQAANRSDFSDAVNIHVIDTVSDAVPQIITFEKPVSCQYFRYLSPKGSFVFMAEIELYNTEGNKLAGKVIGTEGSFDGKGRDRTKVFDGDYLTFFDAPEGSGGWVGLSFPKKESISSLMYLPRNDDNYIRENELYELFYFDKSWMSLGQKTGGKIPSLSFNDVPANALLLLKNHTKGIEERIFTYENGKQVWW